MRQKLVAKMTELMDLQLAVNDLLEEEGENVTNSTKALSLITNNTSEQACQWVIINDMSLVSSSLIIIIYACRLKTTYLMILK